MKSHAIIPIFIPHLGCPHDCIFCDQKKLTANQTPVSPDDIAAIVERNLFTLHDRNIKTVELAFYGGSFTALPVKQQEAYLSVASFYKQNGLIDNIHLSTRPDCIDDGMLDHLKRYGVDIIELGAQSFDDEVLANSFRGHSSEAIRQSSALILEKGFVLGLQLMIGLPGDTPEKSVSSAKELVRIGPSLARLYPTVVIEGTGLHELTLQGKYTPLSLEEAVQTTKEMYKIISGTGIRILRVGIHPVDESLLESPEPYHPAFRQLVEGEIARETLEVQLLSRPDIPHLDMQQLAPNVKPLPYFPVTFRCNERSLSAMIGVERCNRQYFELKYPFLKISYEIDNALADNQYLMVK